ncbi:unnamed protein product [Periconia digitata]|uniref:Uncharacterized protein n=1 Tax=Periconia digitata TaxID=1303443 RepID=A0A9W4UP22_9PLEO|nr:unnamed protein product [Periconia digitata]
MLPLRSLSRPARHCLSRSVILPSPPRIAPLPRRRAFHATARRNDVASVFLYLPHTLLTTLHGVMPWYAAVPLSAFIVRGLLLWGVGTRTRSITARYLGTHPLRQALALQKMDELSKKGGFETAKQGQNLITREIKRATSQLDKRWDCSVYSQLWWTLSTFPVYITMSEVIRRMGNMRDGILGMILDGAGLKDPVTSIHGITLGMIEWFEPTLGAEGMLWFPNLLEPDPNGYLPFMVSGLMLYNVLATNGGKLQLSPKNMTRFSRGVRYVTILMSLMVGPVCQDVPAALMLYWSGSTASIILSNFYLDWKHPVPPKDMGKCERPLLRLAPRKSSRLAPRKSPLRK